MYINILKCLIFFFFQRTFVLSLRFDLYCAQWLKRHKNLNPHNGRSLTLFFKDTPLLSILLRTGILPLARSTVRVDYYLFPPQHNTPFVFRGPQLFSLVVFHTNIDFYYPQVSFPLLFLRSELITVYYTPQHNTPVSTGPVSRSVILHKYGSNTPLSPNTIPIVLLLFKTIDSPLYLGGKQTDILLLWCLI